MRGAQASGESRPDKLQGWRRRPKVTHDEAWAESARARKHCLSASSFAAAALAWPWISLHPFIHSFIHSFIQSSFAWLALSFIVPTLGRLASQLVAASFARWLKGERGDSQEASAVREEEEEEEKGEEA